MAPNDNTPGGQPPLDRTFCISFYEGDLDLLKYSGGSHVVYFKGEENRATYEAFADGPKQFLPNVGFNIFTYLTYILDHYDRLPPVVVFCKNSIYPRHVKEEVFARIVARNVFTPIVDRDYWNRLAFPVSVLCGDMDYLELNDEHYVLGREGKYFSRFADFYAFVFSGVDKPTYVKFAPGANYVVPRENILLRSRSFYENLRLFVAHGQHSLESYFVERLLEAIWTGDLREAPAMSEPLGDRALKALESSAAARRLPRRPVVHVLRKFAQTGTRALSGLLIG